MYVMVELSQADADELTAMLSGASMPPASSAGPDPVGCRRWQRR